MIRPVVVRSAQRDDYPRLAAVFDEAERLHREALPEVFRRPSGLFPSQHLFCLLVDGQDSAVFVAADGLELAGIVTVRAQATVEDEILVPRRYAMVEMLAARCGWRRRGIGTGLMNAAHSWAAGQGLERVSLRVWEFNQPAVAFYQSLGYRTMSRLMEVSLGR